MNLLVRFFSNSFDKVKLVFRKKKKKKKEIEDDLLLLEASQEAKKKSYRDEVIDSSNTYINSLIPYASYYKNEILYKILDQTKYIHELFVKHEELNLNKLVQFHTYYTENFIPLLKKMRDNKNEKILNLQSQLNAVNEKINKITTITNNIDNLKRTYEKKQSDYTSFVSSLTSAIYKHLTEQVDVKVNANGRSVTWNDIKLYNPDFKPFYLNISDLDFQNNYRINLSGENQSKFYNVSSRFNIERTLMGKLNKHNFEIVFIAGFNTGMRQYELFCIKGDNTYFIHDSASGNFYIVEYSKIYHHVENNKTEITENNTKMIDLKNERDIIQSKLDGETKITDTSIQEILDKYLETISKTDYLEDLKSIDMEKKVISEMLKIDMINV